MPSGEFGVGHTGVEAMSNLSVRSALFAGFLLSATIGVLLESAYAQSAKAKPKPQASGQMICNSQGCRPVAPGCRVETAKNAHGSAGQTEVCK
jgi:hypothetical protein